MVANWVWLEVWNFGRKGIKLEKYRGFYAKPVGI